MNTFEYRPEYEQSVLGCMLQDFGTWQAAQPLTVEHFFRSEHKAIYRAISSLVAAGKQPDPVLVSGKLGAELEDCGGLEYLTALERCVPSARNAEHYAKRVRDDATERLLLARSDEIGGIVAQNIPTDEKVNLIAQMFSGIAQNNVRSMPRRIGDIVIERTQYYEDVEFGRIEPGWTTRIPKLDWALTGGFKPGKLITLGALPGVGKSSFAWQLANCMASQGRKSLFLSLEMPETEVADRAVSSMARVDYQALLTGKMVHDDWTRASEALEEMQSLPLYVDQQPALTLMDIRTKARYISGLKFMVLDYLQLCQGVGDNRNAILEEISRGLKALAKELGICILALSQLNRKAEEGKRPSMAHLKDSGSMGQDSDVIFLMWENKVYTDARAQIGLAIEKNRLGRRCDIALDFDKSIQRWGESEEKLYQPQQTKTYSKGLPI